MMYLSTKTKILLALFLLFALSFSFIQANTTLQLEFEKIDREQNNLLTALYQEKTKHQEALALKALKADEKEKKKLEEEAYLRLVAQDLAHQKAKLQREKARERKSKRAKIKEQKCVTLAKQKKMIAQKKLAKKKKSKTTKKQHITAYVDISKQRMKVFKGKKLLYVWRVSTARKGYKTATGTYKAQRIQKMHYSSLYHNSPMPYTIFYHGNYAIHGTRSVRKLGRPASHGCVRLHTKNAKKLYALVRKNGKNNMSIKIVR